MGAMTALLYLVLRYMRSRSGTIGSGSELVQVIASIPILQNKYIQIVDLAGKLLVLGVSENGIHLIHTVDDARTADRIRLYQSHRRDLPAAGLLSDLKRFLKKEGFLERHAAPADGEKTKRDAFESILARETGQPEAKAESEEDQIEYMKGLLKRQRTKIENLKREK
jgi:flagellar biogenesis protein FliO